MGIADAGQNVSGVGSTDAGQADRIRAMMLKQVQRCAQAINRLQFSFNNAPGGAQGVVDELTSAEHTEFSNMVSELVSFYNDHKLTGDADISLTVPSQTE